MAKTQPTHTLIAFVLFVVVIFQFILAEGRHIRLVKKPNGHIYVSGSISKHSLGEDLANQSDELHPSGTNPGRSPGVGHVFAEKLATDVHNQAHHTLRVQIPKASRVHAKNGMNTILKIVNVLHPSDTNPGQSPGVGHSVEEIVSINGHSSKQSKILTREELHPSGTNPGCSPGVGHAVENKNKDTKISEQSRV